jgi:hypothetical protein
MTVVETNFDVKNTLHTRRKHIHVLKLCVCVCVCVCVDITKIIFIENLRF